MSHAVSLPWELVLEMSSFVLPLSVDLVLFWLIGLIHHIDWLFSFLTGDEWDHIMSEVQGTVEFSLELHKFHNVDLFQRG